MKALTLLLIAVIYIACSANNPIEPTTDTTFDFTLKGSNYDILELRFSMKNNTIPDSIASYYTEQIIKNLGHWRH